MCSSDLKYHKYLGNPAVPGATATFIVTQGGEIEYLMIGAGGSGNTGPGGGGGGGGGYTTGKFTVSGTPGSSVSYDILVGQSAGVDTKFMLGGVEQVTRAYGGGNGGKGTSVVVQRDGEDGACGGGGAGYPTGSGPEIGRAHV